MSTQNERVARRIYSEIWNHGNIAVVEELYATDVVDNNPAGPGLPPGIEGVKAVFTMFLQAFPDLQMTIDDVIVEEDKVVVRWSARGSQQGPLMTIPATGKPIQVKGVEIVRLAHEKIVERWGHFDMLGMLQQLGVVPEL